MYYHYLFVILSSFCCLDLLFIAIIINTVIINRPIIDTKATVAPPTAMLIDMVFGFSVDEGNILPPDEAVLGEVALIKDDVTMELV